jgi:septal ring factor EnvC (AmiA/AmiB activator)
MRLGGDYHLVLAGMDAITVKPGQSVAEGQPIGRMAIGSQPDVGSGLAELYLEVRNGNRPVDPGQFLH